MTNPLATPNMPKLSGDFLSIIVPVYNERQTIGIVIEKVLSLDGLLEVIVVDDHSMDGSDAIVAEYAQRDPRVRMLRRGTNGGKTAALVQGIRLSRGDVVIIQDADLELDPSQIVDVVAPIKDGHADVVYGSRFMVKRAARVGYFYHNFFNKVLTFMSNLFTNLNMTDVETCYKAFRGPLIRAMRLTSSGFGFEIEVTAKVAKPRCVIYEVPISYFVRTYEEGKKMKYRDGIAALFYVFRYNLFCSTRNSFDVVPEQFGRNRVVVETEKKSLGTDSI